MNPIMQLMNQNNQGNQSNNNMLNQFMNFKNNFNDNDNQVAANVGVVMMENGTEKANTKSVGYSSASSELVPVSFSIIVRVGESCRVVSNVKEIRVKIIGANWYLYNANITIKMV